MSKGESKAAWIPIKTEEPTPGQRYGHTITYVRPYIIVFGGFNGKMLLNDVWIMSIEEMPFRWHKLAMKSGLPPPRVYHSAALCTSGQNTGTVMLFGGRGKDQGELSDSWGLVRNSNTIFEWIKLPYKGSETPTARFQV